MTTKFLATTAILILALTGCDPSATSVLQISGTYQGSMTDHTDGVSFQQTAVSADVNLTGQSPPPLLLQDSTGKARLTLALTDLGDDSVTLQATLAPSQVVLPPTKLDYDTTSQCYLATDPLKVTLCAADLEISLEIQNPKDQSDLLSAILYRVNGGPAPMKEAPLSYKLSDALARARASSFTSRIEFQHVVQAKLSSRAAYLHLLPQISLGTVANNIAPTWSSALADIGDLAPFLLPNRWIQADQASELAQAEQDTQILMRLDTGVQVEGLFYTYNRDKNTRDLTQKLLNLLTDPQTGIRHQIANREEMGQYTRGSTANIDLVINEVEQSLIVLDQVKVEDLGAISQTLGYFDPTTVTDATLDIPSNNIAQQPDTPDYQSTLKEAFDRSFERDQMDKLIAAAQDNKDAEYFTFLDPYGDPNLFLGFALPSELSIAQSQVDTLTITKQQIESILEQKVLSAVTDYAAAVAGYKKAQQGMVYQNQILKQEMETLEDGVNVDFVGLSVILQNYLSGEIAIETATANYGVAQAEINRLLLQGNYAKF